MTSVLADTIPGIRVVKAFAQEQREIERFRAVQRPRGAGQRPGEPLWSFFGPVVALLTDGRACWSIWVFGVWRMLSRSGDHGRRADAFPGLHQPLLRPHGLDEPHGRRPCSGRRPARSGSSRSSTASPACPNRCTPSPPGRLRGAIELRDVGFHYGTAPVLHGI